MQAPATHVQIREVIGAVYFSVDGGPEQYASARAGETEVSIPELLERLGATSHEVQYRNGARSQGTSRGPVGNW